MAPSMAFNSLVVLMAERLSSRWLLYTKAEMNTSTNISDRWRKIKLWVCACFWEQRLSNHVVLAQVGHANLIRKNAQQFGSKFHENEYKYCSEMVRNHCYFSITPPSAATMASTLLLNLLQQFWMYPLLMLFQATSTADIRLATLLWGVAQASALTWFQILKSRGFRFGELGGQTVLDQNPLDPNRLLR